ncbi:NUDIX domain-containing protein [Candidatus Uhrbacteria bacterium]|jgi:isopentenyldiphosphate isomerase|nr:NUDIX domain-containing protein [Candidatus Uhrbacteria bacterium]
MSEIVKTYLLDEPYVLSPMDRKTFYKEQVAEFEKNGKPSRAVEIVDVFLFNEAGELFVQKRSSNKAHNPGLLDKSIGGHVDDGNAADYTAMVETVQELSVPSVVLRSDDDFHKTHKMLNTYLSTIAILRHEDTRIFEFTKMIGGKECTIANKVNVYFGVYGGKIKTVDQEAKGVLQYTLDDLQDEIKKAPMMFTQELGYFIEYYRAPLDVFVKSIKK